MRRPPRPPAEPLFSWPLVFWSVLQGLLVFVLSGAIFVIASRSAGKRSARADFLLAGPIDRKPDPRQQILQHVPRHGDPTAKPDAGVDHHRGRRYSRTSLLVPALRSLFSFGPLHWDDLSLTLGAAATILVVLELTKTFWRDRLRF